MRTGLTKQEKTTDIWFDEKDPLIYIRTHNTDLKKRLAVYAGQYPDQCRQTDADPETGCMEFEIAKGRFSFRLTAPYSEERRNAASKTAAAKTNFAIAPYDCWIYFVAVPYSRVIAFADTKSRCIAQSRYIGFCQVHFQSNFIRNRFLWNHRLP